MFIYKSNNNNKKISNYLKYYIEIIITKNIYLHIKI
jgi:hypothetical protein